MQRFSLFSAASFFTALLLAANATAQTSPDEPIVIEPPEIVIPDLPQSDLPSDLDPLRPQILEPDTIKPPAADGSDSRVGDIIEGEADIIPDGVTGDTIDKAPDYSQLSAKAEREARLTDLFARLKDETNPEDANLIAEEIWVLWLDSGSASINLVLRRGSDAQAKNQNKKARLMFDNVTRLSPDYAEGWARSSRLALEEEDYSRALNEAIVTLTLEPRHFYALWTMGNAFEQLGRQDEALEAYRDLGQLEDEVEGDVL